MAGRYGALSRSLLSAARSSGGRSLGIRPPPAAASRPQHRRAGGIPIPASSPRNVGDFRSIQSILPLVSCTMAPCLTSHLPAGPRTCCELFHGTFRRTCQDR